MKVLTIRHATVYRYAAPVRFAEHRLMFRPRDSHDLRLVATRLKIAPAAEVRWIYDVFGNSIAIATFTEPADELRLVSEIEVEIYPGSHEVIPIEPWARQLPFSYPADEVPDLARTMERHYPDPEGRVQAWVRAVMEESGATETGEVLAAVNSAVKARFSYNVRTEPGVQTPVETLERGSGTCRDYALFMMEACRSLGLAARFVTGYLYDPALDTGGDAVVGGGATHAWAQVYLPGAGWLDYDPTNGHIGVAHLIRVGVVRDPSQAVPVQGSYLGDRVESTMSVEVSVTSASARDAALAG